MFDAYFFSHHGLRTTQVCTIGNLINSASLACVHSLFDEGRHSEAFRWGARTFEASHRFHMNEINSGLRSLRRKYFVGDVGDNFVIRIKLTSVY